MNAIFQCKSLIDQKLDNAVKACVDRPQLAVPLRTVESVSGVEAECAHLAQSQCEAYSTRTQTLVDDAAKNAPARSEAAIAAWQSAMAATNALVDTLLKSYQQTAQFIEHSVAGTSTAASATTRHATEKASAAAQQ
jgi:hypothetical protein